MSGSDGAESSRAETLRIAGFAGILVVAALRALVSIEPQVQFDVDPARDPMPLLAIGPVGSHLLDVLAALAAAMALVGEARSGRGVHAWLVALAAVPGAVVLWHGEHDSAHAFRGGTFLASAFAFVALAHLVRERRLRVAAIAVLAALAVPLAARGFVQVLVEHPATVAEYREVRESFLADRGWTPDSSAARTYERRLMQAEATGWFSLANPFSTAMGVAAVMLGAFAIEAWRRSQRLHAGVIAAAAMAAAVLLVANGGKGAIGATALGVATLALLLRSGRLAPRGSIALFLAAAAIGAVVLRGLIGTSVGELSLLFRSFYLEGAARLIAQHPWVGVGPAGVQEAFMLAKPAACPEDVTSIHSVFVDWVVAFGVVGVAWVAMVAFVLRGAPRCDAPAAGAAQPRTDASVLALRVAGAGAVLALVVQATAEAQALDGATLVLRAMALAAGVVVAAFLAQAIEGADRRWIACVSVAAAAIVLVHASIETSMWIPGGAMYFLLVPALASGLASGGSRRFAVACAALPLAAAAWLVAQTVDAAALDARLTAAADRVRPLAAMRADFRALADRRGSGQSADLGALLESASDAAGPAGTPQFTELRTALEREDVAAVGTALAAIDGLARRECAAMLLEAAEAHPRTRVPLEAAIKQLAASGRRATGARSTRVVDRAAFDEACALADRQMAAWPGVRSAAMRADLAMEESRTLGPISAERAAALVAPVREASARQPHNARRRADLAEMLAVRAGDDSALRAEAIAVYEDALRIDAQAALDPLARMSERELAAIRAAMARLAPAEPKP